jgi:dGTPase
VRRFTAEYSENPEQSRGRLHPETGVTHRSAFERDRDRVIHSTAFRRLKHKTQVFVYHEGDHFRTRLTHSLEVAQIARSISRVLGLDEDLAETLALAHDLGHTPFGHAGEQELDRLMLPFGGFDHNAQSLRIVTRLERKYAQFDGLNLTWESLEGLVKHNGPLIDKSGNSINHFRERGLPQAIIDYSESHDLKLDTYPSIEAQVAAVADDIAYNAHDIDDGLRAKLFDIIDLGDIPLIGKQLGEVLRLYPGLDRARIIHETVRRIISQMVEDVLSQARQNIEKAKITSADHARAQASALVNFSPQMAS